MSARAIAVGFAAVATVLGVALGTRSFAIPGRHFADAGDLALTARGAGVYARQCARCHGRRLEGQALWQLLDRYRGRRAPALDSTGRAWTRTDDEIFRIVKTGRVPDSAIDGPSHMPAFETLLDDHGIFAVIAYVKTSWPVGLRAMQAARNPGGAGMPREAEAADWRLPATCVSPDETVAQETR